jgi:hypothetical protein
MPGLSSTTKAQVVPMNPDSIDAQSQNNAANPEVQPIGFFEALLVLARGDYMLLSEKQKKETMQDNLTNNYVNVGVMSALLLGMVDITSDGVGDKIVEAGGMPQDVCDYVMVCLNTLAFLLFFLATLQSLINYIIASECTSFEETEQWVEGMGNRLNSHFKLFYGGLVFYLAGRIWILFSLRHSLSPLRCWSYAFSSTWVSSTNRPGVCELFTKRSTMLGRATRGNKGQPGQHGMKATSRARAASLCVPS